MGRLVQQDLEDILSRKMQRLTRKKHLATKLVAGLPPSSPPMAELDQPPPFDARPKHDDRIRQLPMMVLDRPPREFTRSDDLTRSALGCLAESSHTAGRRSNRRERDKTSPFALRTALLKEPATESIVAVR
jgi:hypothetical protein